jgi:hypothetical protein
LSNRQAVRGGCKQVKIPKDMVFYSERRFVAADLLDRTGKIAPAGKMLGTNHRAQ